MKQTSLSELEELILLAVGILREEAYGYTVRQALADSADRQMSLATVHTALYRLEQKGLVRSTLGGATQTRGGRRKRLFILTAAGVAAVKDVQTVRDRMWRLMPATPGGDV